MVEKLSLDDKLIAVYSRTNERRLSDRSIRFVERLKEIDDSVSGELSPEASASCRALYTFLGIHDALKETVRNNGFIDPNISAKEEFFDLYSYYAGAVVSLEYIKKFTNRKETEIKRQPLEFNNGNKTFQDLVDFFIYSVQRKPRDADLSEISRSYFTHVISEILARAKDPRFENLIEQAEQVHIDVKGITLTGFKYRAAEYAEQVEFNGSLEDVVGNKEMKRKLLRSLENALSCDIDKKINVMTELGDFSRAFLIDSRPGTGKTTTLRAIAAHCQKIARENNLDFKVISLDSSFKSPYYGESANNLRKQVEQVYSGNSVYFIVIDDIDLIFHSRQSSRENNADKDSLGVLMNFLEGLVINDLGNYVLAATTNAPLNMECALFERLTKITAAGPETETDYVSLFKIKLGKGIGKYIDVTDDEWAVIGRKCKEYDFSGRAIDKVSSSIIDECNDFEKPAGWFRLSVDEKRNYLQANYKKSNGRGIINEIEQYRLYLQKKEAEEHQQRIELMKKQTLLEQEVYRQVADQNGIR